MEGTRSLESSSGGSSSSRVLWDQAVAEAELLSSSPSSASFATIGAMELIMRLARLDSDYTSEFAGFATGLLAASQVRDQQ